MPFGDEAAADHVCVFIAHSLEGSCELNLAFALTNIFRWMCETDNK